MEQGLTLSLEFTAFDIEVWHQHNCDLDHLTIIDGDGTILMKKSCGSDGNIAIGGHSSKNSTLPPIIRSRSNNVTFMFVTDDKETKTGWSVNWRKIAATAVLSSTAGAAENQGACLGEFVEAGEYEGRPFYRQRETEEEEKKDTFLYSEGGNWRIGDTLGGSTSNLKNTQNSNKPPLRQWTYWDGKKWNDNDTTLTLEFTTLSPCQLVRVAGEGDVVKEQGSSLGDYRSVCIKLLSIMQGQISSSQDLQLGSSLSRLLLLRGGGARP